jgi:integrase
MVDSRTPVPIDVRAVGRHMSRQRYQRGSLKKVGKTRKMWRGRWHVYVKQADGSERLCKRERILGPVSELTKGHAHEKLDALIKASTAQSSGELPIDAAFAEVWKRYAALKSASWSTATRKAVTSIFAGESAKKDHPNVLAMIGWRPARELTRDPLQQMLNQMATRGDSYSVVKKARTYLAAALEYARDEKLVADNAARKLELPTQVLRKPCERYYSLKEVQRLLSEAHGREHLVLRIFINCGLRPGELFALREDDVEPGQLRIDEAIKEVERGERRIGETKTAGSRAYVGISKGLQAELEMWIAARRQNQPYHASASAAASSLLFTSETGTTFRLGNYLKRYLKPLAERAGIADMTYQALRRTCATHFQKHGKPRDIQAQLRHSKLEMTGRYVKELPDQVRAAVESMDRELCVGEAQKEQKGSVQ